MTPNIGRCEPTRQRGRRRAYASATELQVDGYVACPQAVVFAAHPLPAKTTANHEKVPHEIDNVHLTVVTLSKFAATRALRRAGR